MPSSALNIFLDFLECSRLLAASRSFHADHSSLPCLSDWRLLTSLGLNMMQLITNSYPSPPLPHVHILPWNFPSRGRVSLPTSGILAKLRLASVSRMLQKGGAWASAPLQASACSLRSPLSPYERAGSGLHADPSWGRLRSANLEGDHKLSWRPS